VLDGACLRWEQRPSGSPCGDQPLRWPRAGYTQVGALVGECRGRDPAGGSFRSSARLAPHPQPWRGLARARDGQSGLVAAYGRASVGGRYASRQLAPRCCRSPSRACVGICGARGSSSNDANGCRRHRVAAGRIAARPARARGPGEVQSASSRSPGGAEASGGAQLWVGAGVPSMCCIWVICAVWLVSMFLARCFARGFAPDACSVLAMSTAS
jgi:hypothetical protein